MRRLRSADFKGNNAMQNYFSAKTAAAFMGNPFDR